MTDQIKNVCKIGQGAACCKYLVVGANGFECMKVDRMARAMIDKNWEQIKHIAQGDNCDGKKDLKK